MSQGMLGNGRSLDEFLRGPIATLFGQVNGKDGRVVLAQLNRFLRREPCWGDLTIPDTEPKSPNQNWRVVDHIPHQLKSQVAYDEENLYLNSRRIVLHRSPEQLLVRRSNFFEIKKSLEGFDLLNCNVLDFLLLHPEIVPDSWEHDEFKDQRRIFFPGTTYCQDSPEQYLLQCMYFQPNSWYRGRQWCLGDQWARACSFAVLEK